MHLLTVGLLRETSFLRLVYPNKPPLSRGIFPLLPRTHRAKGGVADALCHLQPQVGAHRPGGVHRKPGGAVPELSGGPLSRRKAGGGGGLRGRGLLRKGFPASPVPPDAGGHPPGAAGGPGVLPAGPGEPQRGRLCRPHPAAGGVGGGLPLHPGEVRHLHPHGQGHDVHCQRLRPTGAGDHRPAGAGQHVPAGPDGAVAGGYHPHRLPGGADGGGDRGRPRPHRLPAGPRPRGVGPRRGHLPAVSGPAEPQRPVPCLGGGGHHRPHRAALLPARPAGAAAKSGVLRRRRRRLGLFCRPGGRPLLSPGGLRRPPGPAGLPEAGLLRRPRPP